MQPSGNRLEALYGNRKGQYWMNLRSYYDLDTARDAADAEIRRVVTQHYATVKLAV